MLLSELNPGQRFLLFLGKNWVVFFLLFLCVLFSFTGTGFLSPKTLNNILITSSPALLLAAGETFVIITGGIDLSVGFVRGLISVISAIIMRDLYAAGYSPYVAILWGIVVGIGIGLLPGLVNGILVAKFRVPPFIATFGMYGIAYGVSEILCNSVPIAGLPALAGFIGNGYLLYYLPGQSFTWFSPPQGIAREEIRSLIPLFPNVFMLSLLAIVYSDFCLYSLSYPFRTAHLCHRGKYRCCSSTSWYPCGPSSYKSVYDFFLFCLFIRSSGYSYFSYWSSYPVCFKSGAFAVAAVVIEEPVHRGKGLHVGNLSGSIGTIGLRNWLSYESGILPFYRYVAVGVTLIIADLIHQSFPKLVYD